MISAPAVVGSTPVAVTKPENWFTGIGSPFFIFEISFDKIGIEPKIATTQIYVRLIERKVSDDMAILKQKFNTSSTDKQQNEAL